MRIQRVISRRIRRSGSGFDVRADVNAAVSANVKEDRTASAGSTSQASSTDHGRARADHRGKENR